MWRSGTGTFPKHPWPTCSPAGWGVLSQSRAKKTSPRWVQRNYKKRSRGRPTLDPRTARRAEKERMKTRRIRNSLRS